VLADNASIPNLYAKLEQWLGADRLIFVDEQPGDSLGHINHFRFIGPDKVLIGKPDVEGTPLFNYLSKIRSLFLQSGYEVIDIPCPERFDLILPGGDYVATVLYTNCLIMNERVIMSVCHQPGMEKYNDKARQAYGKAFPGYEIIPIDASILTNGGGGIYCSTREIPEIS
jgi:agmatine deiminase